MAIDTNGDLKIDLQEALVSLNMTQENGTTPQWFTELDTNHDGFLESKEFDSDLDDTVMGGVQGTDDRNEMLVETNEFNPDFNSAFLRAEKPEVEAEEDEDEDFEDEEAEVNSEDDDEE